MHERVVERRVVGRAPLVGATGDPCVAELLLPALRQGRAGHVEVEAVAGLLGEVGAGAVCTRVAEADLHRHRRRTGRERHSRTVTAVLGRCIAGAGGEGGSAPGAEGAEGAVELGAEPDRVLVLAGTEVAVVDASLDDPVTDDVHLRVEDAHVCLAGVEQHVGRLVGREGEPLPAGAVGRGELRLDAVGRQSDAVVAGARLLVGVGVARRVARGVDARDGTARRHDGQLADDRTADARQVRLAEAVDRVLRVVVAALSPGVRTDLDHAEGRAGTGERVPVVLRADERVDALDERLGRRSRRGCAGGQHGPEGGRSEDEGAERSEHDAHGAFLHGRTTVS